MVNEQNTRARGDSLWATNRSSSSPIPSSSSSVDSSSSDCETLSDSSTTADAAENYTSARASTGGVDPALSGQTLVTDHNILDFQGGLSMLPCFLAPALSGTFSTKDECRLCTRHKRTSTVINILKAHQTLDTIELSDQILSAGNSTLIAALSKLVRRATLSPASAQSSRKGSEHDWVALHVALASLQGDLLLDSSGDLLRGRLKALISGTGPDSFEEWFLSCVTACAERLQARLTRLLGRQQKGSGPSHCFRSDAYKKGLAHKQAKAFTHCLKLIGQARPVSKADEALDAPTWGCLDLELSCFERALLVSTSPTLLLDVTGGPCQRAGAWDAFDGRVARYLLSHTYSCQAETDRSSEEGASSDMAVLSKIKHLVLLGTRGDVNQFLHRATPLMPHVDTLCLIDTFWLHSSDPRYVNSVLQEQIYSTRWTLPPNIVRLRALRQCVAVEFAVDDRQKDVIHVFAIHGSHKAERSLMDHPDVRGTAREGTCPERQRSLQVKLHDRIRLNTSIAATIQGKPRFELVKSVSEAEGENVKAWSRIVALYDARYGETQDSNPCSWVSEAFGDSRRSEPRQRTEDLDFRSQEVSPPPTLERLTSMCLRTIGTTLADEEGHRDLELLDALPPHFRWVLDLSYRCVSCCRVVLPPTRHPQPNRLQGFTASMSSADASDGHLASSDSAWTDCDTQPDSDGPSEGGSHASSLPVDPEDVYSPEGIERIFSDPSLLEIDLDALSDEEDETLLYHVLDNPLVSPAVRFGLLARAHFVQQVWKAILDADFLPPMKEEIRLLRARRGSDDDDELADVWAALKSGLAPQHMYRSEQIDVHALIGPSSTMPRQDALSHLLAASALDTDSDGSSASAASSDDHTGVQKRHGSNASGSGTSFPCHSNRQSPHSSIVTPASSLSWRFCLPCFRSHVLLSRPSGSNGVTTASRRARLQRNPPTPLQLQEELAALEAAAIASNGGKRCECVVCREERDGSHYAKPGMGCWVRTRRIPNLF